MSLLKLLHKIQVNGTQLLLLPNSCKVKLWILSFSQVVIKWTLLAWVVLKNSASVFPWKILLSPIAQDLSVPTLTQQAKLWNKTELPLSVTLSVIYLMEVHAAIVRPLTPPPLQLLTPKLMLQNWWWAYLDWCLQF